MKIADGLVIERLRRDEGPAPPPSRTLGSDERGKNPRRRRKGDFAATLL